MNEVTRVHLGRQAYTISVDAHRILKKYLAAIQEQVSDEDVMKEVELRMSELLQEHGVSGEKTILPEDVAYLQEQLGSPADFGEAGETEGKTHETATREQAGKRLFRDTDNALIAGVASGLANYSGLDAVLIRLIFVLLTIFGAGIGIVLYLLFWLAVPAAETTSEKLQMRGQAVTLASLKNSVSRADVPGAARRVNRTVLPIINHIFRLIIKLIGVGFILAGVGIIAGLAVAEFYMLLHHGKLMQENLFPIGAREHWLLGISMVLGVVGALFLMLIGLATFTRKWPVRAWVTGLLVGIFLVGSVAAAALAADTVPRVRDRYEAGLHTTAIQGIQPFNKVVTSGSIDISYVSSPNYAVNVHYFGHPDLSKLNIRVKDQTLYVDSSHLDAVQHCNMLCIFPGYDMTVQIYAPNVQNFNTPPHTDIFYPAPSSLN